MVCWGEAYEPTPHPFPLPIRWGEGGRRPGEGWLWSQCAVGKALELTSEFWRCSPFLDISVSFKKTARLMAEPKSHELMEKIVSLCKRRGFIFHSSEIYGGINGFWDYGPLGAELKRNVKDLWWRAMVHNREDVVGLEATIIMHPKIWEASGHTSTFSDPMVDCLLTKKRFRADQIEPQSGLAYHYTGAAGADGT